MLAIRRYLKGAKGFTLIEIAIVVAIIGLLIAIALPLFTGARVRAYVAESRSISSEWKSSAWACLLERNFNESRCDSASEVGWTLPPASGAWDWPTVVFICGNFPAGITATQAASTCAGNITGADAAVAVRVPRVSPAPDGLNNDYVLAIKISTGEVRESPADGTTITISP